MWTRLVCTAMLATLMAGASVAAPALPPEPGSTSEMRRALKLIDDDKLSDAFDLLVRGCDKNDAEACHLLATLDSLTLQVYGRMTPAAARTAFAAKSARLYAERCAGAKDDEEACDDYGRNLRELRRWTKKNDPARTAEVDALALTGGRMIARKCLAGELTNCSMAESLLEGGTPAERDALRRHLDLGRGAACERGQSDLCWSALRNAAPASAAPLRQAAEAGCRAGWSNICLALGQALTSLAGLRDLPAGADAFARACKTPPKSDEKDNRKLACDAEARVRKAIAAGA